MPHSGLKHCHIVTIGSYKDWPGQKIKDWVENASGKVTSSPRDDTTHAVITAKAWKQKPAILQEVLARKQNGQAIHVVDFEWLEKSLQTRAKRGENNFCYERREREIVKAVEKERKQMQKIDKAIQPKTVAGMLTQEFLGHTDQYVDQKEKQRALEKARAEAVARKEREEEKRKAFESQRDELRLALVAEIFKNGAKKSRDVLLSDNHHIYVDSTGFYYDIVLSKINPYNKKENEVWELTLQIFESNTEPHTYAFNTKFTNSSTSHLEKNMIAAIGSDYAVAFRAFKKVFKEHTGVEWNDRFKAAEERENNQGSRRPKSERQVEFKNMPFLYHPPTYGPKGDLPEPTRGQLAAATIQRKWRENVAALCGEQYLMSGANGLGPGNSPVDVSSEDDGDPADDLERLGIEADLEAERKLLEKAFDDPYPPSQSIYEPDTTPADQDDLSTSGVGKRKEVPESGEVEGSAEKKAKTAETADEQYPFEFGEDDADGQNNQQYPFEFGNNVADEGGEGGKGENGEDLREYPFDFEDGGDTPRTVAE